MDLLPVGSVTVRNCSSGSYSYLVVRGVVPSSTAHTLPCTSNHVICGLPAGFVAVGGAVTVFLHSFAADPGNVANSYLVVVINVPGVSSRVCRSRRSQSIVVLYADLLVLYVPIEPNGSWTGQYTVIGRPRASYSVNGVTSMTSVAGEVGLVYTVASCLDCVCRPTPSTNVEVSIVLSGCRTSKLWATA